ncbi:MAG: DUF1659 domain-containing protein [Bacillota bacterium]|jgi:hypothetical protein
MPVERVALNSRLSVRYQVGVDEQDQPIYSTRTLANVKSDGSDEALWAVAAAISGLQKYPVAEVRRIDNSVLAQA